jgi:hypothetical protein
VVSRCADRLCSVDFQWHGFVVARYSLFCSGCMLGDPGFIGQMK